MFTLAQLRMRAVPLVDVDNGDHMHVLPPIHHSHVLGALAHVQLVRKVPLVDDNILKHTHTHARACLKKTTRFEAHTHTCARCHAESPS